MQDFKGIVAWQRACKLGIAVHKAARGFARHGHADLRKQLTKAADSIATNIVEGAGAATNKEFARYLDISVKSANETEHHLLVSGEHGLIPPDRWQRLTAETIEVRKMTYGYRKSVLKNDAQQSSRPAARNSTLYPSLAVDVEIPNEGEEASKKSSKLAPPD